MGSAIASNAVHRQALRDAWETLHVYQGEPTASILRYDVAGGDQWTGQSATPTLVANLAGLRTVTSRPGGYLSQARSPTNVQLREGDRVITFLDIPATTGVAANTLQASDVIEFEGRHWQCVEGSIDNDSEIGVSYGIFRLTGRDG